MSKSLPTNSFAGGATIDLNKPTPVAYNPNDPKNEFPKMLYHQTKKDANWLAEHKRITLYNNLHPEKPEILPHVPAAFVIVKNKKEEEQMIASGFGLRPPAIEEVDQFGKETDTDETLCARGCGNPPHKGACKSRAN